VGKLLAHGFFLLLKAVGAENPHGLFSVNSKLKI
jgi:hypothetical protein